MGFGLGLRLGFGFGFGFGFGVGGRGRGWSAVDDGGVGGEAVHELARLVAVVEGDVLAEQVEEELPPQARDEALARVREEEAAQEGEEPAQAEDQQQEQRHLLQPRLLLRVRARLDLHRRDEHADEVRHGHLRGGGEEERDGRQHEQRVLRPSKAQQPTDRRAARLALRLPPLLELPRLRGARLPPRRETWLGLGLGLGLGFGLGLANPNPNPNPAGSRAHFGGDGARGPPTPRSTG